MKAVGKRIRLVFPFTAIKVIGGIHRAADKIIVDFDMADFQQIGVVAIFVILQTSEFTFRKLSFQDLHRHLAADGIFSEPYFAVTTFAALGKQGAGT